MPDWEAAEKFFQDLLGLDTTVASGSQFYDQGDAVNRAHYTDDDFTVIADSKSTNRKSYSITRKFMEEWFEKAALHGGKRFLLHIEFQDPDGQKPNMDLVVSEASDYSEIYHKARAPESVILKMQELTPERKRAIADLRFLISQIQEPQLRARYLDALSLLEDAFA